jgi:hypothetical protein
MNKKKYTEICQRPWKTRSFQRFGQYQYVNKFIKDLKIKQVIF